jgi:hypothetical protein
LKAKCKVLLDKAKEGGPLDAHTKGSTTPLPPLPHVFLVHGFALHPTSLPLLYLDFSLRSPLPRSLFWLLLEIADSSPEIFLTLPQTLEEIDVGIQDCLRKADALFIANPRVIEDYEARGRKIDALQAKVEELLESMESAKNKIQETEVLKKTQT